VKGDLSTIAPAVLKGLTNRGGLVLLPLRTEVDLYHALQHMFDPDSELKHSFIQLPQIVRGPFRQLGDRCFYRYLFIIDELEAWQVLNIDPTVAFPQTAGEDMFFLDYLCPIMCPKVGQNTPVVLEQLHNRVTTRRPVLQAFLTDALPLHVVDPHLFVTATSLREKLQTEAAPGTLLAAFSADFEMIAETAPPPRDTSTGAGATDHLSRSLGSTPTDRPDVGASPTVPLGSAEETASVSVNRKALRAR